MYVWNAARWLAGGASSRNMTTLYWEIVDGTQPRPVGGRLPGEAVLGSAAGNHALASLVEVDVRGVPGAVVEREDLERRGVRGRTEDGDQDEAEQGGEQTFHEYLPLGGASFLKKVS